MPALSADDGDVSNTENGKRAKRWVAKCLYMYLTSRLTRTGMTGRVTVWIEVFLGVTELVIESQPNGMFRNRFCGCSGHRCFRTAKRFIFLSIEY